MVTRAKLAGAVAQAAHHPISSLFTADSTFQDYVQLSREYPDATPLGIEECAGMIAGATHQFLEANPQYKLENL